jgi:hypothetical protein
MELLSSQTQAQPRAAQIGQIIIEQVKKEAERTAEQTVADVKEDEFDKKSAQVQAYVGKQLATRNNISEEAQKELACAIRLIGDISTTDKPWIRKNLQLLGSIDTALKAALKEPPQIEYARRTLKHVHRRVHPVIGAGLWESLKRSMKSSPAAVVVVGLVVTFVVLTFVPLLSRGLDLSSVTIGTFLNINPSVLLLIGIVGALGSIASIMLRIRDSAFATYTASSDPWPWLFFGLFKPIVGALFALFIFAVIRSGLLPVKITDATEGWLVLAVAFIAGFSERFATDILSSTEQGLGVGRQPSSAPSSSTPPLTADNGAKAAGNGVPPAPAANAAEAGHKDDG